MKEALVNKIKNSLPTGATLKSAKPLDNEPRVRVVYTYQGRTFVTTLSTHADNRHK